MKLTISNEAAKSVKAVVDYIEMQNTKGSGRRWFAKLEKYLEGLSQIHREFLYANTLHSRKGI